MLLLARNMLYYSVQKAKRFRRNIVVATATWLEKKNKPEDNAKKHQSLSRCNNVDDKENKEKSHKASIVLTNWRPTSNIHPPALQQE